MGYTHTVVVINISAAHQRARGRPSPPMGVLSTLLAGWRPVLVGVPPVVKSIHLAPPARRAPPTAASQTRPTLKDKRWVSLSVLALYYEVKLH